MSPKIKADVNDGVNQNFELVRWYIQNLKVGIIIVEILGVCLIDLGVLLIEMEKKCMISVKYQDAVCILHFLLFSCRSALVLVA